MHLAQHVLGRTDAMAKARLPDEPWFFASDCNDVEKLPLTVPQKPV
jgi:hypothetical protein